MLQICLLLFCVGAGAQDDPDNPSLLQVKDTVRSAYNPNRPATAAFYSAALPGLGQAYNKQYWKIPIVYAALGTAIYVFIDRQNEYLELRDAYRSRLAGRMDDRFITDDGTILLSTRGLERSQQVAQRNKELALLITGVIYLLNIIDANVNGHLSQFNTDRDLSIKPMLDANNLTYGASYGLTVRYTF